MSKKRAATTEMNHENWDRDDPEEQKEMGMFTPANIDIIDKRVIKTAKRRAPNSGDGTTRSVFSGFGGFNKKQPSSFDFLQNLTNGSKPTNGSPSSKSDTTVSSSLFSANPGSGSSGGLFSIPVSSTSTTASTFVMPNSQSSSLFGGPISTTSTSAFTASKADSTVGNFSFKPQTPAGLADNTKTDSSSAVSSTMFGIPPNNTETKKSLFSTAASSTPFKIQSISSTNTTTPSSIITPVADSKTSAEKDSDKKSNYYTKLKGLNESVSDWIKKHVDKTPLCILSPIFKDYEKHLKDIQDEYHGSGSNDAAVKHSEDKVAVESKPEVEPVKTSLFSATAATGSSLFSNSNLLKANSSSPFSTQSSPLNSFGDKLAGVNNPPSTPTTGFSFGLNSSPQNTTLTGNTTSPPPFSFGIGKPFNINNFNAPNPKPAEADNEEEAEEDPSEYKFTPVVEKDSLYDKKCKIFVKNDDKFVEKGVGNLYIKKIEESGKHQLLVRADTSLGKVLLNLILSSSLPTQKRGKNNVMMVCIPTPDAKPPPVTVLIRVKTSEEADELLETLNKYKA